MKHPKTFLIPGTLLQAKKEWWLVRDGALTNITNKLIFFIKYELCVSQGGSSRIHVYYFLHKGEVWHYKSYIELTPKLVDECFWAKEL